MNQLKKMNQKILYILLSGFLSISAFTQESETRELTGFTGVEVTGNIRCELYFSDKERVEVLPDKAGFEDIITEVKGNVLSLRLKTDTPKEAKVKIRVYYNRIEKLISQNQALITNQDTLRADHINFIARSGGKMELLLKLSTLSADVKQGGTLVLSGKVEKQEIKVSSAAAYSAYKLDARDTYVKAVSGGKAKVVATRIIDATASAKAFVGYTGEPVSTFIKTSLGGEIQHSLDPEE